MFAVIGSGMVLGLSAGFSPGPLMALVIRQTLRHGVGEGLKVAAAPLVTDFPIIAIALYILTGLSDNRSVLGVISLAGAFFLIFLARDSFRTVRVDTGAPDAAPRSLAKGIMVNFLSPHPYIFWLTVGGPIIARGGGGVPVRACAFIAAFMGCLVGSKIAIAMAVGRSRQFLGGRGYAAVMKVLGLLLVLCAGLLMRDGLEMTGLL